MIYNLLKEGNTSLVSRKKIVERWGGDPTIIPVLLAFTFDDTCEVKVLASVILDDLLQVNSQLLDPYIVEFVHQLPLVRDESVKRLTSKIAVLLLEKRAILLDSSLEEQLLNQSLLWLTTETKVATEANAMQIVLLLRAKFPEQTQLIADLIAVRFHEKTPAYQSKARKLFKKVMNDGI